MSKVYSSILPMQFMGRIRRIAGSFMTNLQGWRTSRKLVVIESDDWGSIRMPSKEIYLNIVKSNRNIGKFPFVKYDALESESDLGYLFEVLSSVKDAKGNFAKMTTNFVVSNPDFELIEKNEFQNYFHEPLFETYKKYPEHSECINLIREGIRTNLIKPQFHGREHLNVNRWMNALQRNVPEVRFAFSNRLFDLSESYTITGNSFMDALNWITENEIAEQAAYLTDGLKMFKDIFEFESDTFIAPNYIWDKRLEQYLYESGIRGFQGGRYQLNPTGFNLNDFNRIRHFTGQRNDLGQVFLVRNVFFEPFTNNSIDWIDNAVFQVRQAYALSKPAIISTHRANYIGFIDRKNRDTNLPLLQDLLKTVIKIWPETEFLSSDRLCRIILDDDE